MLALMLPPFELVGVGGSGGAQCAGHAMRAGSKAHPEHPMVATDFRDEFNTISCEAVLQAVADRQPRLLPL